MSARDSTRGTVVCVGLALVLAAQCAPAPPGARADAGPARDGHPESEGDDASGRARGGTRRRPVPDLDHRPAPRPALGERLLAVPRLVLAPVWVLFEYGLRRPVGLALTESERRGLGAIFDFLLFDEQRGGVVPVAFFDFDFQPSGGFYFFHDAAGSDANKLQIWASTGGRHWLRGTVEDRLRLPLGRSLTVRVDVWRRPDQLFYGLGPDRPSSNRSRYERTFADVDVVLRQRFGLASSLTWSLHLGHDRFDDTRYGDEPSVPESVAAGRFERPPGFARGYTAIGHELRLVVDGRRPWPAPGGGAMVEASVVQRVDAEQTRTSWLRLEATLAGFHDVGGRRVLGLAVHAEDLVQTGEGAVPFTERVALGQRPLLLGGFVPGRLIGESALVGAVTYTYPVWALADAALHASVGNVFGPHLEGLTPGLLRLSFGIGLRTTRSADHVFTAQLAFGSEPFERGARIESVRVYFGATQL